MKRRSALFALTATFAAGLLLFSSAQGQGGSEPPSEDPGRPEGTNDCIERTNRIDCVESVLEVIAKDSTNCLADVGSRIVFDFEVNGYSVDEIEHTFINACPNKTNYTERVTNAVDVVWTITGGQGGVVASGSELPVELSYTNLWPGVYTAELTASVCSETVTKTASVYLVKTFMAGGPYIGINATDTPMGKDGVGHTNITGFAAFTIPSIPDAPNQVFTFTLEPPAICAFSNNTTVIAVPAVTGTAVTVVYELDKPSTALTNEVIKVTDPYGGCLASNRFTVVRVDVSMDGTTQDNEESLGAFIPWNIDRDWAAGSSDPNAFANILDHQTNHFASADDDLRQVKISVLPNDLPLVEEVELTGYEYLWEDQAKTRPATNVYTLATLSNTTFWVEGRAISGTLTNMSITATHKLSGATDRVNYTVVGLAVEHPKYLGIDATGETGLPGKDDAIEIKGKLMPIGVPQGSGDIEYEIVQSNAGCTFNPAVGAIALLHEADKPSNTGEWETFKISCPTGTALPIISSVRVVRVEVELRALAEDKEETPGAFIGYNGDDDNFSNAEDCGETNVTGEDDLVECKISILPDDLPDNEMIDLTGNIANVWQAKEKDAPVPPEFSIYDLNGLQFWIEGHDASGGPADKNLQAQHRLSHAKDRAKYTCIKVDLDAMKVRHNVANGELPDMYETGPGAFVPINYDDDDYDASNTADKDQSGSITGESDLLPIKLHKVEPELAGSKYTLDILSQVKIWQNADRSGPVGGTTEFDANLDTTLYAEGCTVGSGSVKVNWKDSSTALVVCDEVKVTVFKWVGPLNVPGFGIYQYKAEGALGHSKWTAPSSGSIKTGENTSDVTILWEGGPVVGEAIYQVNGDYLWNLEVNVVQTKLKMDASNKLTYGGNPPVQAASLMQIHSTGGNPPPPAIVAELTIEKLEGPNVAGSPRGVKFIEMGFCQDVVNTRLHSNFNGFSPPRKRKFSVANGVRYLDGNPGGVVPWYDPTGLTVVNALGFYAQPLSDATVNGIDFKIGDRPTLPGTDTMTLTIPPLLLAQSVDSFEIEANFNLYFAIRTVDSNNDANLTYTKRASASWAFDGSGTIDAAGHWTQTGTGNTGSASFSEVTDGTAVPTTTIPWMNDAGAKGTWSTELQ